MSTHEIDKINESSDIELTPDEGATPLGGLDRRAFMGFFSTTSLAGTLFPGVLWAHLQQRGPQPEPTITIEMIAEAEKIAGLELTDEEREGDASRSRPQYRLLPADSRPRHPQRGAPGVAVRAPP